MDDVVKYLHCIRAILKEIYVINRTTQGVVEFI